MTMSKGTPGKRKGAPKSGGRKKGTPNKVTASMREFIADLLDSNREQFAADLQAVTPETRLHIMEKLMQYVIPKRQAVRAEIDTLTDAELCDLASIILNDMTP